MAGGERLRVEIVDPAEDPAIEDEANMKYGIRPVPFQVADRYQASLVNSYFDVLINYGDEYEVLSFRDLIEVKVVGEIKDQRGLLRCYVLDYCSVNFCRAFNCFIPILTNKLVFCQHLSNY